MAIREITDSKGVQWRVWCTMPEAHSPLAHYYPGGWLTFDCGSSTLRRLSPAPANWESVSDERLLLMCRVAQEVPRHTGEVLRMSRPADLPFSADEPERPPSSAPPEEEEGRPDA